MFRTRGMKLLVAALTVTLSVALTGTAHGAALKLELDGYPLRSDVPPVVESGRVLVPFRALLEGLGALVGWEPETRTAVAVRQGITIRLTVDSKVAVVNGQQVLIDVPARTISGHIFVPARFVSEALGAAVPWPVHVPARTFAFQRAGFRSCRQPLRAGV